MPLLAWVALLLLLAGPPAALSADEPTAAHTAGTAQSLPMRPARRIAFDTDEGTWISLTASPDGRRIAFDLLGDLYTVSTQGGRAGRITSGMAFDSQPAFSPDGSHLAFISDRSGAENLWVARPDGSDARRITHNELAHEYASPAWAADGRSVFVSLYRADRNAIELWRYPLDGGSGKELTGGRFSALGAAPSPDGRYVYYAAHEGPVFEDDVHLPLWSIRQYDLRTGRQDTVVTAQGSAMRPALSPDGRLLVYATRLDGETALRIRDLASGADRPLRWPVQHDDQEALPTRDLMPAVSFAPDGRSVYTSFGGRIQRLELATGAAHAVPFLAHVDLGLGPFLRQSLVESTGPVRARIIQTPMQSPDGRRVAFSALGRIYLLDLHSGATPRRLTRASGSPEFMPAWSADGRSIVYVTWDSQQGGQVWITPADGSQSPRPIAPAGPYYTNPVFGPDGRSVFVVRSSTYERLHMYQEPEFTGRLFGELRHADLVQLQSGAARVITFGMMSGKPQFVRGSPDIYLNTDKGLEAVSPDGLRRRLVVNVVGPGYYFLEGTTQADDLEISPDGRHALAQLGQQLYLVRLAHPESGGTIDLSTPAADQRRITTVGADFCGWSGARTVTWALGSTFFRRPLAGIAFGNDLPPLRPEAGIDGVEAFVADVELPRDTPHGKLVLRGGTAITMRGDEVIPNADVVIIDNRIAAIGPRGSVRIPMGATIMDVSGRYILPGFIDVHDHFAAIRRGVLELDDWEFKANLAYGVTAALDPSTLSIDMLAYEDLIDSGEVLGPRLYQTATAIFSFNRFRSLQDAQDVVSRYVDYYHTRNLKEYRTGNRRQREWLAMAAYDQHAMPTTEGALDMKLDLTQMIDGFSGNEHALSAYPLYRDVIQLMVRSRVSYDTTLQISHGGPPAAEDFIARTHPHEDPKVRYLYPHFARDKLFTRVPWVDPQEEVYPKVAAAEAQVARAGGLIAVGSHGNYPGIGYDWELLALASGGLSPFEVLHAATLGSAETIGRESELGSLTPGKLADLIILDENPLAAIANTSSLREVMKNGRLYDAGTLAQLWPDKIPAPLRWFATGEKRAAAPGSPPR